MDKLRFLLMSVFVLILFTSNAQFEIQGIIRPRFEYRNGYGTLRNDTTKPAAFVSQRSRLNIIYKNKKVQLKFSFFDFRVWGDQVWKKDISTIGLNEAWGKFSINDYCSVKLGRQSLKYDNSRLISAVNWNQIGAAHDAAVVHFKKNNWIIDIGAAWNQSGQNKFGTYYDNYKSYYKSLNFLWFSKRFNLLNLASLNIIDGMQDSNNSEIINFRSTNGITLDYKVDKFKLTTRLYFQNGKLKDGQRLRAYYTNIDLKMFVNKNFSIIMGNEIKSGNDATDSLNTTNNAFDIAYGGRHKFNGRIDYFSTPSTTKDAGLVDSYLKTDYKLSKDTRLFAEYHYFLLQNNYIHNGSVQDKFMGHEIDLVVKYNIETNVRLEAGYSFILGSKTLDIIKSGDSKLWNNWFYLMLTIDPTLFSNK